MRGNGLSLRLCGSPKLPVFAFGEKEKVAPRAMLGCAIVCGVDEVEGDVECLLHRVPPTVLEERIVEDGGEVPGRFV